ncbi:MAG: hypothetical protein JWR84_341 [Caulobacter sp.]|nr:hypothetical protein [Caulobacter sp.]
MRPIAPVGLVLAALLCVAADKPMKPGTSNPYNGYITSGGRFGVRIGDSVEQADIALRKHLKVKFNNENYRCDFRLKRHVACEGMQQIGFYYISETFRNGELFVESRDGKVVSMIWRMQLRPYLDS